MCMKSEAHMMSAFDQAVRAKSCCLQIVRVL